MCTVRSEMLCFFFIAPREIENAFEKEKSLSENRQRLFICRDPGMIEKELIEKKSFDRKKSSALGRKAMCGPPKG